MGQNFWWRAKFWVRAKILGQGRYLWFGMKFWVDNILVWFGEILVHGCREIDPISSTNMDEGTGPISSGLGRPTSSMSQLDAESRISSQLRDWTGNDDDTKKNKLHFCQKFLAFM